MAGAVKKLIQAVRDLALGGDSGHGDGELLEAFRQNGDEHAISALIRRHSGMIWGVCRRVLGAGPDAEDAFQATFLVLVQKASSIRDPQRIANWLYGVAQQTAVRMRAQRAKRGNRERQVEGMPERDAPAPTSNHLEPILDEELSRLPEIYRAVIVLCDLEDKPRSAVAKQLGCPEGTIAARLSRGREMLASRLTRRGIATTSGALAIVLSVQAASAAPAPLILATIHSATTGAVSASVAALTQGVLQAMFFSRIKLVVAVLVATLAFATGSILMYAAATSFNEPERVAVPVQKEDKLKDAPKEDKLKDAPQKQPDKGEPADLEHRMVFIGFALDAPKSWKLTRMIRNKGDIDLYEYAVPAAKEGGLLVTRFLVSERRDFEHMYAQFTQDDGGDTKKRSKLEKRKILGYEVQIVDISGTFLEGKTKRPDYRKLAAIVREGEFLSYSFELWGPKRTVGEHEKAFRAMLEKMQPNVQPNFKEPD